MRSGEERSDEALRILRDMTRQRHEQLLLWRLTSLFAAPYLVSNVVNTSFFVVARFARYRSRTQQGCDSFKTCGKGANWGASHGPARKKNHWSFYCDNFNSLPNAQNMIAQCLDVPKYRCHTSYDTNWSLNAVMVKREVMLNSEVRENGVRSEATKTATG